MKWLFRILWFMQNFRQSSRALYFIRFTSHNRSPFSNELFKWSMLSLKNPWWSLFLKCLSYSIDIVKPRSGVLDNFSHQRSLSVPRNDRGKHVLVPRLLLNNQLTLMLIICTWSGQCDEITKVFLVFETSQATQETVTVAFNRVRVTLLA